MRTVRTRSSIRASEAMTADANPFQSVERSEMDLRLLCLLPSIPLGGMERAAIRVAKDLMARGVHVHFLAERRWGVAVQREIEAAGADWTGISLPASFGRPKTFIEARATAVSLLRSGGEISRARQAFQANAILATTVNVAYLARRVARRADVVSVFRIPNPPGDRGMAAGMWVNRAIWRAVNHSFDHMVCNSAYTAQRVADIIGDASKVRLVRNFPPALDRPIRQPAPRLPGARINVIYLGQISEAKGVAVLLEAAKAVVAQRDDVDFLLAGPSPWLDPFPADLKMRIETAGLGDRVRLLGSVEDVGGLLRQGHVHVCPSLSRGDSFPNVILDAKQAGLPSIVFPTAGLPEAVERGVDGIVTGEASSLDLTRAILDLIDNPAKREQMGAAALLSLSRFDPDLLAEQWLTLFKTAK